MIDIDTVVSKPTEMEDLLQTRKSLLSRLKNRRDQESWGAFFDIYGRLIYGTAIRSGLCKEDAEDVLQETVVSVCKAIPNFRYDSRTGSFRGWLLQMTKWRIKDHFRDLAKQRKCERVQFDYDYDPDRSANGFARAPELEALWDEEWEKTLLRGAMERVKGRVDPRNYQLFHLSVMQQWPLKKICSFLNVSAARVHIARFRISNSIKRELEHLQTKIC